MGCNFCFYLTHALGGTRQAPEFYGCLADRRGGMREQRIFCICGNIPLLTGQAIDEAAHFIIYIIYYLELHILLLSMVGINHQL